MVILIGIGLCFGSFFYGLNAWGQKDDRIQLSLKPQVCTLAENEEYCDALIEIDWQSRQLENLCLEILEFPEVEHCWEASRKGNHRVELQFAEDLDIELRDSDTQEILAARTIKVVREAIRYRRKRRQPWNIFS